MIDHDIATEIRALLAEWQARQPDLDRADLTCAVLARAGATYERLSAADDARDAVLAGRDAIEARIVALLADALCEPLPREGETPLALLADGFIVIATADGCNRVVPPDRVLTLD